MPSEPGVETARAALRQKQGAGARYDAAKAPHDDLLLARQGTAFFARKLAALTDSALYGPSEIVGQSCARIVVQISLAARRDALVLDTLCVRHAGQSGPGLDLPLPDLDLAESLPPHAIRHLFRHTEVHLNVRWRDLTDAQWDRSLDLAEEPGLTPRALPRRRAVQIWHAARNLDKSATFRDIPSILRDA